MIMSSAVIAAPVDLNTPGHCLHWVVLQRSSDFHQTDYTKPLLFIAEGDLPGRPGQRAALGRRPGG